MSLTLVNGSNQAYAHEKITNLSASTALTAATYDATQGTQIGSPDSGAGNSYRPPAHPEEALITVETGAIRYTYNGTTPTTSASTAIGHICQANDSIQLLGYQNIVRFRAINETAGSGAELRVTYAY
jgi:hypothetical protein